MSTTHARQPAGVPIGGQFAAKSNPESSLELEDAASPADDFGDVSNIAEGSRTPWGQAQHVERLAPGIAVVDTAGHGGVKLSAQRNKRVPAPLRNSSGWYEEDCEAYVPALIYPVEFSCDGEDVDALQERARQGVIDWMPEKYEAAFGVRLPIGASHTKDRRTWEDLHAENEVAVSASSGPDPETVLVTVRKGGRRGSDDRSSVLLVPKDDYRDPANSYPLGKHPGSFVVDPHRGYEDVTPPPGPAPAPRPRWRGIDTSGLTPLQQSRAERDLNRRWKFQDRGVVSTRDLIAQGGISGKWADRGGSKTVYYLRAPKEPEGAPETSVGYALEVSKACWDAVQAPAD
jgi:hypothetical protein